MGGRQKQSRAEQLAQQRAVLGGGLGVEAALSSQSAVVAVETDEQREHGSVWP